MQRTVYDRNGQVVRLIRPNEYDAQTDSGDDFQFTYDAQGRGLTVLSPDGHVLQRAIPTTPMAGCSSAWMAWAAV